VAPAREAGSAGDMPEVPKGRGFAGLACSHLFSSRVTKKIQKFVCVLLGFFLGGQGVDGRVNASVLHYAFDRPANEIGFVFDNLTLPWQSQTRRIASAYPQGNEMRAHNILHCPAGVFEFVGDLKEYTTEAALGNKPLSVSDHSKSNGGTHSSTEKSAENNVEAHLIALMVGMMLGAWLGVALATTDMWWPIWYKQRLSSANVQGDSRLPVARLLPRA